MRPFDFGRMKSQISNFELRNFAEHFYRFRNAPSVPAYSYIFPVVQENCKSTSPLPLVVIKQDGRKQHLYTVNQSLVITASSWLSIGDAKEIPLAICVDEDPSSS